MLKIAIVENDREQQQCFNKYVALFAEEYGEECVTVNFFNGVDFLTDYTEDVDAVFMDIDMPLMDGMTAAKKLREKDENVNIVFVTNLAQYALKGYKVNALDYLVKPVDYFEFAVELKKIQRMKRATSGDFVWLNAQGILKRIPAIDIVYVDVMGHKVYVHTTKEVIVLRGALKEMEDMLSGAMFSRCHNCYIVNLKYVTAVEGDMISLENSENKVFISRNRKAKFMKDLTNFVATYGKYGGYGFNEKNKL